MKPYSIGGPVGPDARRLHLNEFRYPHPAEVVAALQGAVTELPTEDLLTNYQSGPDPALAADLARYVAAPNARNIVITPGSDEALRAVIDTSGMRGHRAVIMGVPGYTHFEHYARLKALEVVTYSVGLGSAAADLEASLRYHAGRLEAGSLVYLCSPNNPTGDLWSAASVAALASEYPRSLFLVDEAYVEFASVADLASGDAVTDLASRSADIASRAANLTSREGAANLASREGAANLASKAAYLASVARDFASRAQDLASGALVLAHGPVDLASGALVLAHGPADLDATFTALGAASALNAKSLVRVALAFPNVVVTRTLSKAFGLAALRIGYAVGSPDIIAELGAAVSPKAFGPIASLVARAALRNLPHYLGAAVAARREAAAVTAALRAAGWWALDTPGNFFLVYVATATTTAAALAARGLHVRDRDDLPGLAGFVRITAGSAADSAEVLAAFGALTPPAGPPPQTLYSGKGHIAACKTLMKKTLRVLRASGVEFFATAGTLLGMVRHGGMIPWDDDCDLAYVRDPARDQGLDLVAAFRAAGLTFQRNRTDAYWQIGTNVPGEAISPVHIDFFSYSAVSAPNSAAQAPNSAELVYELDDPRFRDESPDSPRADCNTRYAPAELYPLRADLRFYDEMIPVPAQTEAVLRRALGADFMTVAKIRRGEGAFVAFPLCDRTPA